MEGEGRKRRGLSDLILKLLCKDMGGRGPVHATAIKVCAAGGPGETPRASSNPCCLRMCQSICQSLQLQNEGHKQM